jgi:transmembrane sensor
MVLSVKMRNKQLQYASFQIADFINDEKLIAWAKMPTDKILLDYWNEVFELLPQQVQVIMQAVEVVTSITDMQVWTNEEHRGIVLERINSAIAQKEKKRQNKYGLLRLMVSYKAAAILLLLAGIAIVAIWIGQGTRISANSNTVSKVIRLPDYSLVTLGANSTIKYSPSWNKKSVRELWLDGQARFEVNHLHKGQTPVRDFERFIVHLRKNIDVEVLGTVFTVFQRDDITEIKLEQGKVKVVLKGSPSRSVFLEPGKTLRMSGDSMEILSNTIMPPNAGVSAADNILQLNNTPVADIIQVIEKTYHKKVIIEDPSILLRRVDGILPLKNENEVVFILTGILNVTIDNGSPGEIKIKAKN